MYMPYPRKVPRPAPEGHVTVEEVMQILDMSQATLYRYRRESKDFPKPMMQGGRAWYSRAEIEAWKAKYMIVESE